MRYRWFADEEEKQDEFGRPRVRVPAAPQDAPERMSHGESAGMALSAVIFLYGLGIQDVPIVFVAAAFLLYELRRFTPLLGEPWGSFLGNLLRGFSIVLFLGAIFMVFL